VCVEYVEQVGDQHQIVGAEQRKPQVDVNVERMCPRRAVAEPVDSLEPRSARCSGISPSLAYTGLAASAVNGVPDCALNPRPNRRGTCCAGATCYPSANSGEMAPSRYRESDVIWAIWR
jgi:hypothetical protein